MPKVTKQKLGEIHRVKVEKTFWDQCVEVFQGIIGLLVILMILGAIFG